MDASRLAVQSTCLDSVRAERRIAHQKRGAGEVEGAGEVSGGGEETQAHNLNSVEEDDDEEEDID